MKPYEDPNHEYNSERYHTGQLCVGCHVKPAGTRWSPHFCQKCNAERINRVDDQLNKILSRMKREGP